MMLSEYIRQLQELLAEHGDAGVVDSYDEEIAAPEFHEDGPVYVICDKA